MTKEKLSFIVLLAYFILCISPYFVNALNQINPKIFGIPFTVWSGLLIVTVFCFYLLYLSKNVWYSYDNDERRG